MQSLLFAFQFLTILPIPIGKELNPKSISGSIAYFPVVGLVLGLILGLLNMIFQNASASALLTNVSLIVTLAVLTGAFHLDGLADTFDALGSFREKEKALSIMRDSAIGAMGAVALISVILLKIASLSAMNYEERTHALISACMLSRCAMAVALWHFPYAREEGKGKEFFAGMDLSKLILAVVLTAPVVIFLLSWKGAVLILVALACVLAFGHWTSRKLGGITGDVLGAINELTELAVLFTASFLL